MPGPSSRTASRSVPFCRPALTTRPVPRGVWVNALLTRMRSTWATRSGSQSASIGERAMRSSICESCAAIAGAKRVGASKYALIGAAIGTLAGIFTGLWGLLFMPLVGAAIGEFIAQRDWDRAGKVGIATWIGLLLGTAIKVAIVFAMVGAFVVALVL